MSPGVSSSDHLKFIITPACVYLSFKDYRTVFANWAVEFLQKCACCPGEVLFATSNRSGKRGLPRSKSVGCGEDSFPCLDFYTPHLAAVYFDRY